MEETVRLWIRDLGFPITVAAVAIYALYKMFMLREQLASAHNAALEKHASELKDINGTLVQAFTQNTLATKELSENMKSLCRANECKAEELVRKNLH